MVALKINVHDLTTRTCEYDLIWKKGLYRYDCIKDLEPVSSWIIQVGLKPMISGDRRGEDVDVEEKAM